MASRKEARIHNIDESDESQMSSNNYANSVMTVSGSVIVNGTDNDTQGYNALSSVLDTQEFWEEDVDFDFKEVWYKEDGQFPKLLWEIGVLPEDMASVTFMQPDASGGSIPRNQIVRIGEEFTIPYEIPTRSGYVFSRWVLTYQGSDTIIAKYSQGNSFIVSENCVLSQIWSGQPTAPTNITRTGTYPTCNMSWTRPQGEDLVIAGYKVYVNDVLKTTTTNTSYSFTLSEKGKYTVEIEAYNAVGSAKGTYVDAWLTTPAKPILEIIETTKYDIKIRVTSPEDRGGYDKYNESYNHRLYFQVTPTPGAQISDVLRNEHVWEAWLTDLRAGQSYIPGTEYRLYMYERYYHPVTGSLISLYTDPQYIYATTLPPSTLPGPVRNLSISLVRNTLKLNLTWDEPTTWGDSFNVKSYKIVQGSNTYTTSNTSYELTMPSQGTYSFDVYAVNDAGESTKITSSGVTARVASNVGHPTTTYNHGARTTTFTWAKPQDNGGDITGYVLDITQNGVNVINNLNVGNVLTYTTGQNVITYGDNFTGTLKTVNTLGTNSGYGINRFVMTYPYAPTFTIEGLDMALKVTIDGIDNGGSAITKYQYKLDSGTWIDVTSTTFTISGLNNDQSYNIQLRGVNNEGNGDITTKPGTPLYNPTVKPTVVRNLQATTPTDTKNIVLTWTEPETWGDDRFTKRYKVTIGGLAYNVINPTFTYTTGSLGTTYTCIVVAENDAGVGPQSQVSATTNNVPNHASSTVTTNTYSFPNKTWNVSWSGFASRGSAITGYEYRIDSGSYVDVGNVTSYTIPNLAKSTSYSLSVRAKSVLGYSSQKTVSITTPSPSTKPSLPQNFNAVAVLNSSNINITWTAPTTWGDYQDTRQYLIYNGTTLIATKTNTDTSHVFAGSAGTAYTFKIIARNDAGDSAEVTKSVTQNNVPSSTDPNIRAGTYTLSTQTLRVQFNAFNNNGSTITKYEVKKDNGVWISTGTNLYIDTTDILFNTSYTFYVRATNSVGVSTEHSKVLTVTPTVKPSVPRSVAVSRPRKNYTEFKIDWQEPTTWGDSQATKKYIIGVYMEGTLVTTEDVGNVLTYTYTYVNNATNRGKTWYFRVYARNDAGDSSYTQSSNIMSMTFPDPVTNVRFVEYDRFTQKSRFLWDIPEPKDTDPDIVEYRLKMSSGSEVLVTPAQLDAAWYSGLVVGQTYSMIVTSQALVNGSTTTTVSSTNYNVTITGTVPPTVPRNPLISNVSNENKFTLQWTDPESWGDYGSVQGFNIIMYKNGTQIGTPVTLGKVNTYVYNYNQNSTP